MEVVHGPAEIDRQAALHLLNSRKLNAFEDPADQTTVQVCALRSDRQVVRERNRSPVTEIEV